MSNITSQAILDRFRAKLSPYRQAAITLAETIYTVSDITITGIEPCNKRDLNLDKLYTHANRDLQFYAIKQERNSGKQDCREAISSRVWRAAILYRMCSKTVYCLIDKVREVCKGRDSYCLPPPILMNDRGRRRRRSAIYQATHRLRTRVLPSKY